MPANEYRQRTIALTRKAKQHLKSLWVCDLCTRSRGLVTSHPMRLERCPRLADAALWHMAQIRNIGSQL